MAGVMRHRLFTAVTFWRTRVEGNKKKWDSALNSGGVIGGLACGAIVGVFAFANVDPNNIPRWARRAPIFAVIGGAYVGTVIWEKRFSKPDPLVAAVAAAHEQIVDRGAECSHCNLHHTDYRLTTQGKSLDDPCIICCSCGRSSASTEFSGVSIVAQSTA